MLIVIRVLLVGIVFFSTALIAVVFSLFCPFNPRPAAIFRKVMSPLSLKILGVKVDIRDPQHLLENHPCVFIGNHQSILDLFLFSYLLPSRNITVGKKSIRWIPIFGWLFYLAGHLLIDRKNNERAVATMKKAKETLLRKNLNAFVMPEGTRSRGKGLGPFKKGAFYLAIECQIPIQPIVASSFHKCLQLKKWNPGTIIIEVLPPIPTVGKTAEDVDELLQQSRTLVQSTLDRIDAEA